MPQGGLGAARVQEVRHSDCEEPTLHTPTYNTRVYSLSSVFAHGLYFFLGGYILADMQKDAIWTAIARVIKRCGSQKAAAASLGITQSYLSDLKTGRREPGAKVLTALGFKRVTNYERVA